MRGTKTTEGTSSIEEELPSGCAQANAHTPDICCRGLGSKLERIFRAQLRSSIAICAMTRGGIHTARIALLGPRLCTRVPSRAAQSLVCKARLTSKCVRLCECCAECALRRTRLPPASGSLGAEAAAATSLESPKLFW